MWNPNTKVDVFKKCFDRIWQHPPGGEKYRKIWWREKSDGEKNLMERKIWWREISDGEKNLMERKIWERKIDHKKEIFQKKIGKLSPSGYLTTPSLSRQEITKLMTGNCVGTVPRRDSPVNVMKHPGRGRKEVPVTFNPLIELNHQGVWF